MPFSTVYEDPWTRTQIDLSDVAVQHLELIETFLKLLQHICDAEGRISDETLTYSEWRYAMYLRFIDVRGFCPNDHPPPWDVALIMYLHMLSPSRFHHYVYDNRNRNLNGIFGLEHRHFPMSKLLKGEWCPRRTKNAWDECSKMSWSGSECRGSNLPYQLWPSAPWKPRRLSILGGKADLPPCLDRKWITPTDKKLEEIPKDQQGKVILMHQWDRCRTSVPEQGYKVWDLQSYAAIRTCRVEERCRSQSQHEQFNETCMLKPWPSLQDLRADLEQQVSFWKVILQVKNSVPGFVENLKNSVVDYEDFLGLLGSVLPKSDRDGSYKSKLDPKTANASRHPSSRPSRILPPTLEIDLLWKTHRLFPASYWVWSTEKADWVLDREHTANTQAMSILLQHTRQIWKSKYTSELERGVSVEETLTEYVPDSVKHAPANVERTDLKTLLLGRDAWKQRRVIRRGRGDDISGGGGAGDYGGSGGCDGGGGGGDGGGGGE
ncbi:hypothetical protein FOQG_16020 [Fusarium oxysporum f. sp. raphani 54005]|uniref:Uncharacterized protein n=3 Tax=Fusarium oxysporum f. sp. raphani TaxID=96318 RepID=X0C9K7_FUSOX|nr:hypothetical protein FOQG_16020 [Fusarium oxysporum f. sp. raphani 54005]KAG7427550.1 hypothetical protein Forpi1262_v011275 [Fusarium oxysporum f. sp. raphani]